MDTYGVVQSGLYRIIRGHGDGGNSCVSRTSIRSIVEYRIGDGSEFYLWKDPWHTLGPLIDRFPRGPSRLGLHENATLNSVIHENQWQWPLITDMECLEITHTLPRIDGGSDRII